MAPRLYLGLNLNFAKYVFGRRHSIDLARDQLGLRHLEHQLVMHLQQHARRQPGGLQRAGHADHGALDDVGGGALEQEALKAARKMLSGKFTLIDMREQMEALTKMGPLSKVMEMVPGMSGMMKKGQMDETQDRLEKFKVLMSSMTKEELENPKIIKRSRINRIAKGSGSDPQEIRELLKQYNQSRKMMSNLGGNRRMQQRMMKQFGKGDLKL